MAPTIPKICGVKRSIFCTLVSVWACIMLSAMGGLLSYKSLAFVEDLAAEPKDYDYNPAKFYEKQDHHFELAANNCYVALGMYGVTFVVSIYHWVVYHKRGLA